MIAGRGPSPSLVATLVRALPDTSLTSALASGGREHFGWGVDRHLQADLYDAINVNTTATGQYKKPPNIPAWPRPDPDATSPAEKKPVTVADLYSKFAGKGATNL